MEAYFCFLAGADDAAPHWLEIDLEGTYVLSSSTIWTGILGSSGPDSGTAPAKYFRLQYWKDDGWVDIPGASISNTPKGTGRVEFTFEEEVVTTKVRLVAEDDDFVRFREVMIFGLPMED